MGGPHGKSRPNIVLFVTDDHGHWTLPAYGNTECRTPTFDWLCENGARFDQAFTPTPVSSPARACIMTGKIASQHGVHDWIDQTRPEFEDRDWLAHDTTLAEWLSSVGYLCGHSGKMHLGRAWQALAGYDDYFGIPGYTGVHNGPCTYVLNGRPYPLNGNQSDAFTNHALDFLSRAAGKKPFFLSVGYTSTHSPYTGHRSDRVDAYRDATFRDIPAYESHRWQANESFPRDGSHTEEDRLIRFRNQYAAVSEIDEGVGRVVSMLREKGQLNNTVIIYTSDHGLSFGHAGFWGKGNGTRPLNMYDISIRVPLIIYAPDRVPAGKVVSACVDHLDTFQYVCDIAGVNLEEPGADPLRHPGSSYRPLLESGTSDWDDTRFGEYGDLRMVRTPEYKLVRRYPSGPDDLFDLNSDPLEKTNRIDDAELAGVRDSLQGRLDAYFDRYEVRERSGLRVKELPQHNRGTEAWRDGVREKRGCQI